MLERLKPPAPPLPKFLLRRQILLMGLIYRVELYGDELSTYLMQVLRTRWTGWRAFFGHKRTAIKVLALIVMIMEALGMNF